MKRLILTILFFGTIVSAQDNPDRMKFPGKMKIMTSDEYYWGSGTAVNKEEARNSALKALIGTVVTYIFSENTDFKTETASGSESTVESASTVYIKTFNRLKIRNLRYLEEEKEYGYEVFAYTSKEDFYASLAELEAELGSEYRLLKNKETAGNAVSLLNQWYSVYLRTFFSPVPLAVKSEAGEIIVPNLAADLKNKISELLGSLVIGNVNVEGVKTEEAIFRISGKITAGGNPVPDLWLRDVKPSSSEIPVNSGEFSYFHDGLPGSRQENLRVFLAPFISKEEELYPLHKAFGLQVKKEISADFSEFITIGFSHSVTGSGMYVFTPEITGMNVTGVKWIFEEGASSSSDLKPSYRPASVPFTVRLTVNSSDALSVTKLIQGSSPGKDIQNPAPVYAGDKDPEPAYTPPPASNPAPVDKRAEPLLKELTSLGTFQEILPRLEEYSKAGLLSFGNKKDFKNPGYCHVIIIDPATKRVSAFASPASGGVRTDLLSGGVVSPDNEKFKGYAKIWFLLLVK